VRSPTEEPGIRGELAVVEERRAELDMAIGGRPPGLYDDFREKFMISWVYHDNALEGVVLTYHELRCAIDQDIVSDSSLIPTYDEIRAHKTAIQLVYELADRKRGAVGLETMKRIYAAMLPEVGDVKNVRYRKDTPLHRLYFHEIAPPEKISYRMRRLTEWLGTAEARNMSPVKLAAKVHFRLMHIYPFPKASGKLARLVMNLILLRSGYQPAIIHATERQRYYDVLRQQHSGLTKLVCESVINSTESAIRYVLEPEAETTNGRASVVAF
jgi:Fic family protein